MMIMDNKVYKMVVLLEDLDSTFLICLEENNLLAHVKENLD
jgi:hypothetical protein